MKTITKNNSSVYLLNDSDFVEITSEYTIIGNPPIKIVSDCKTENAVLHENVTAPEDWIGNKYLYMDGQWLNNPDYIEPPEPPAQPIATGTQDL